MNSQAQGWADALIDFGPYNTLLHFKDTRTATLDLTNAVPESLSSLLAGRKARLGSLFLDSAEHNSACTRARGLRRKLVELDEEQGIEAGRLALGLLLVDSPATRGTAPVPPLRAPLLLYPLAVQPRTASENDFVLQVDGEAEINPVLLYALSRQYGMDGDIEELAEKAAGAIEECADPADQIRVVYDILAQALSRSRLTVTFEDRVVAGAFSFDRLPMVNDLRTSARLLADHPVIAALAGEREAARTLLEHASSGEPAGADDIQPCMEFLVHDADASQQRAISAALAGEHLVIEGPPGTGKSQTIANLIAALSAQGRRVLFVAEKRAAIEAVTDRLARVDLSGLVFDLHGNKLNRRQIAQQLQESLERAGQEVPPRQDDLHTRLERYRHQARQHVDEFHQPRTPWQVSAHDALTHLTGCPPAHHTRQRLRGRYLRQLHGVALEQAEQDLRTFVAGRGLAIRRGESPWARTGARTVEELRPVLAELDHLSGTAFHDTRREIEALVQTAGLRPATDITGWQELLSLLQAVAETLEHFTEDVFGPQLDRLVAATADRAWRKRNDQRLGWWQRRGLVKAARALRRDGLRERRALHIGLARAAEQSAQWQSLSTDGATPSTVPGLSQALEHFTELRNRLTAVALCARLDGLEAKPTEEVAQVIQQLDGDRDTLLRMPELNQLTDRLEAAGLGSLLDDLAHQDAAPDAAVGIMQFAWWSSVLDEAKLQSSYVRAFTGREHDHIVSEFRRKDAEHLAGNAHRVRYRVATRLRKVRDAHQDQNTVVRTQARRKTRHLPLRKLVEKAPDVLLAAKPCWAMSPLVVSRVLPAERLFDVVIFDEASQILPHDAIASIMRARQVIVAGDPHQLPPSSFFTRTLSGAADQREEDDEENEDTPGIFESLLDMLSSRLPHVHTLRWHYRSSDERLIAFSNRNIYEDRLVTFPGTAVDSPIRLETVDGHVSPGQSGSAPAEVERVVKLALDHAALRPHLSLGVITMGQRHADRIDLALRKALDDHPELQSFFSPDAGPGNRFFIKNLERVQGDERDAIILSIGYAKAANGRLSMRFGPLNNEGGERRLNVAVTRARESMTVVSSFSHHDFDPRLLSTVRNQGPELLRRFLEYCAHRGDLESTGRQHAAYELNPFEQQVLATLEHAGIPVVPQWGVSDYRIDFALAHPERPGQMLLAVETDGDRYHRAPSARDRDRLRQAHLERLGWRFHRIWASDWFHAPQTETARVLEAWEEAVRSADDPSEYGDEPLTREASSPPEEVAKRGRRPALPTGSRITDFSDTDLASLARWLLSDGYQLDRDTRISQAIAELGFKKRGRVIVERLTRAFEQAQQAADRESIR
ncbi:AAA domain-containing protein [Streptomyces scopuliridis]|uniref:AAA domain-containing protein n=1 Tax=Streptomyces scopuliridis TaxID=452529 RepID=UPI00368D7500